MSVQNKKCQQDRRFNIARLYSRERVNNSGSIYTTQGVYYLTQGLTYTIQTCTTDTEVLNDSIIWSLRVNNSRLITDIQK